MKFEKLNYSSGSVKKAFVIGIVVTLLFIVVINFFLTRAKYQVTESIPLANGIINYTLVDFELVEIKVKGLNDSDYRDGITTILEGNYVLNENDSYCTEKYVNEDNSFEDVKNENLKINFDKETNTISVSPYSKKGTKCHLFFEESLPPLCEEGDTMCETLLGNATINASCPEASADGIAKITGVERTNAMICKANDDYGTSYYYRGKESATNNWVVFGKDKNGTNYLWWRIIRINGNGTIRLIYAGTSSSQSSAPNPQGVETMILPTRNAGGSYPRAVVFNKTDNDNKYVGYMYNSTSETSTTHDQAHKVDSSSTNSRVLDEIQNWYTNNTNLGSLAKYIDVDTGFCSDTTVSKINHGSIYPGTGSNLGYGDTATAYAGADRVWQTSSTSYRTDEQTPTLKCGTDDTSRKRDLYTGPSATNGGTKGSSGTNVEGNNALPVPVGLITMDEVIYAGGFAGETNNRYWLYTDQYYWTMSPSVFNAWACVFYVYYNGKIEHQDVNGLFTGVRPVINLKADTKITGSGDPDDPYIVQTS